MKRTQKNRKISRRTYLTIMIVATYIVMLIMHLGYFIFYLITTAKLYDLLKHGISEEALLLINQFVKTYDKEFLTMALEIIGIAISVWIGLNIYNIISKEKVESIESLSKSTEENLREFKIHYLQFSQAALENAIIQEDRINNYFIDTLKKDYSDIIDYKMIKNIVFIERSLGNVIDYYKALNFSEMKKCLTKFFDYIDTFGKVADLANPNPSARSFIKSYITCREGEYYYYLGLLHLGLNEKRTALNSLNTARDKYVGVLTELADCHKNNQIVKTYINNALSYISQLFFIHKGESKYATQARQFSILACSDRFGNFIETEYARDHRNYGVNIENELRAYETNDDDWFKSMYKAYEQYNIALKYDIYDVKTLTTISSCVLKLLDKMIQINSDDTGYYRQLSTNDINNVFEQVDDKFKKYKISELLDRAYNCAMLAESYGPNYIAPHYHAIHIYMYRYLLTQTEVEKEELIDLAKSEISQCGIYYSCRGLKPDIAFLYKTRNFYFAIGEKSKGTEYESLIQNMKK